MITDRWNKGENAGTEMRKVEEEWLLRLCRDIAVNIRIRSAERADTSDRSELAGALAAFLRDKDLSLPLVGGGNNRFLTNLQQGTVENFDSHFQEGPYGDGSIGDEQSRWNEFKSFREFFACPGCGRFRFKRPGGMDKPVCAIEGCEAQFEFAVPAPPKG